VWKIQRFRRELVVGAGSVVVPIKKYSQSVALWVVVWLLFPINKVLEDLFDYHFVFYHTD